MTFRFDHATVDAIVDGDTFWAVIDLGVRVSTRQKIRMRGVQAVEMSDFRGGEARDLLMALLPPAVPVTLVSHSWTYDRLECDVMAADGFDVCAGQAQALRDAGLWGGR